jgi:site-specific recombinase XerD
MPNALQIVEAAPNSILILPQETSDDGMVALWLGTYRRSAHTRRGYEADVQAFRRFVAKPLRSVTGTDVIGFADSLLDLSPSTQARRLSAVKSLFALLLRQGLVPVNVAAAIQLPAIKDTLLERIMEEEAVQNLLWAAEASPRFGRLSKRTARFTKRNAALLRVLYGTGMRISEACGLRWRDLTGHDVECFLNVFGKGGKTRPVRLTKSLWDRLQGLRGNAGPDDPIFQSRENGPLDPSQVHRIMKTAAKNAKLPPEISVHWLRHAHATHSLQRGCPVHVLQATLGHASLKTTDRYTHFRPEESSVKYLVA